MNRTIRKYLIEKARRCETVVYSELMQVVKLDHHFTKDRKKIGDILGAISKFEHKEGRPLLSVIAVDKGTGFPNNGFYNLAELNSIGKMDDLETINYISQEIQRCFIYWKNEDNYRRYANQPEFFAVDELNYLSKWAGKSYDKNNSEHIAASTKIKETLWDKTQYCAREIAKRLDGFVIKGDQNWFKREGQGVPFSFRCYTWMRIFRFGDDNKDIFFTVGVDEPEKALV